MHVEWLLDDDTALHLSFDEIDFCVGAALERFHSRRTAGHLIPNHCNHRADHEKGSQSPDCVPRSNRCTKIVDAYAEQTDRTLPCRRLSQ